MIDAKTKEIIMDAFGTEVPGPLCNMFDELDKIISDANDGNGNLRSTQVISLVILLWKRGILK